MEGKRCFNSFLEIYLGFYVSSRNTTIRWKLKKQMNKGKLRSNWYQNFRNLGAKLISKIHFGPYKPYWVYFADGLGVFPVKRVRSLNIGASPNWNGSHVVDSGTEQMPCKSRAHYRICRHLGVTYLWCLQCVSISWPTPPHFVRILYTENPQIWGYFDSPPPSISE